MPAERPRQDAAHLVVRLDRHHLGEPRGEGAHFSLSGAGGQVDDARVGAETEHLRGSIERFGCVLGPHVVVLGGDPAEAEGQLRHGASSGRPCGSGVFTSRSAGTSSRRRLANGAPVLLGLVRDRADREQVRDPLVARVEDLRAPPRPRAAPRTGRPPPAGASPRRARAAGPALPPRSNASSITASASSPSVARTRPGCSRATRARRRAEARARSPRPHVVGEPVERLAGEDAHRPRVRERDLSAAGPRAQRSGTRSSRIARSSSSGSTAMTCANRGASSRVSLPVPAPRSSTVALVEPQLGEQVEQLRRPAAAAPTVVLGARAPEARARLDQPTPARRKARFSFSISRAITRRWIWFVPS